MMARGRGCLLPEEAQHQGFPISMRSRPRSRPGYLRDSPLRLLIPSYPECGRPPNGWLSSAILLPVGNISGFKSDRVSVTSEM